MVQLSLNFAGVNSVSMRDSLGSKEKLNLSCSSQDSCTRWDSPGGIVSGRKRRGTATDSSLTPTFLELKRAHETYLSDCPQNISLWLPHGSEPWYMGLWRTHDNIIPKAQYPPPLLLPQHQHHFPLLSPNHCQDFVLYSYGSLLYYFAWSFIFVILDEYLNFI